MCKIVKSGRGRQGRGVVLEIRTHPDKGRGWFENTRFWRTSFVDGPLQVLISISALSNFFYREAETVDPHVSQGDSSRSFARFWGVEGNKGEKQTR